MSNTNRELLNIKQRFGIIGNDKSLDRALEIALRVAPTDLAVFVTGESGVGKEFFPQIIHAYSARKHNKYIAVNCGAIPEGTIESELFGHEKGAFTGASDSRKGYFEEANGGTIFLDEVAELPESTQVRLLRVLQTGEFIRVGSSKTQKTDVRVVTATNIDIQEAVTSGQFREDLFYRLNTVPIHVPPLRNRKGDISLLFRKFASDIAEQYRMPVISLDAKAQEMLENYPWPGNIRQLKNVAEQISAIEETREINEPIMQKYLPRMESSPIHIEDQKSFGNERDLLYRLLFDMKADISDLKRMMTELFRYTSSTSDEGKGISGYLTSGSSYPPAVIHSQPHKTEREEPQDVPSEEIVEEDESPTAGMTKEEAMREEIVRALRRHGGRRKDAAKDLFISERTLYRRIKDLEIDEI